MVRRRIRSVSHFVKRCIVDHSFLTDLQFLSGNHPFIALPFGTDGHLHIHDAAGDSIVVEFVGNKTASPGMDNLTGTSNT
jgi:hypothetical protein